MSLPEGDELHDQHPESWSPLSPNSVGQVLRGADPLDTTSLHDGSDRLDPFAYDVVNLSIEDDPDRIDPFAEDKSSSSSAETTIGSLSDPDDITREIRRQFGPRSIGVGTQMQASPYGAEPDILAEDTVANPASDIAAEELLEIDDSDRIDPFADDIHLLNMDEPPAWAVEQPVRQLNTGSDVSFGGGTFIPEPVSKAEPIAVIIDRDPQQNSSPHYVHPDAVAGTHIHNVIDKALRDEKDIPQDELPIWPGGGERPRFVSHFADNLQNPELADALEKAIPDVGRSAARQLRELAGETFQWTSEVPFMPPKEKRTIAANLLPELVPNAFEIAHNPSRFRLQLIDGDAVMDALLDRVGISRGQIAKDGLTLQQMRELAHHATPEEIANSTALNRAVLPLVEVARYARSWGIGEEDFQRLRAKGMPEAYRRLVAGLGVKPDAIGLSANSSDGQEIIDALNRITKGTHFGRRQMYDLSDLPDTDTRQLANLLGAILAGESPVDFAIAEHKTRLSVGGARHPDWDNITMSGVQTNRAMEQIAMDMAYTAGGITTWAANMAQELVHGYPSLARAGELDRAVQNGHRSRTYTNDQLRRRIERGLAQHMSAIYTDIRGEVIYAGQKHEDPSTYFRGYFGVRPDFGSKPEDVLTARAISVDPEVLYILSNTTMNKEMRRRVLKRLIGY